MTVPGFSETEEFSRYKSYETRIAKSADAVFTLNGLMRAELLSRGVPAEKIILAPNGVGDPQKTDPGVTRQSLGLTPKFVLGYIGSFSTYEAVDDCLKALKMLLLWTVERNPS